MNDKAMGRAEFLKFFFRKTVSTAYELADDFTEPLHQAEEKAQKILTQPLIPVEEYQGEPKLLASSKPPIYIVGEPGKNLIGLSAVCRKDGFLLSYLPQENSLYCSACSAKHVISLDDENAGVDLPVIPLTVKKGYIYLVK